MGGECEDVTGRCDCVEDVRGDKCDVCRDGYHLIDEGCVGRLEIQSEVLNLPVPFPSLLYPLLSPLCLPPQPVQRATARLQWSST